MDAEPVQTYEVGIQAFALRTIKVRATSGREALDIAASRVRCRSGPWTIDFPGGEDEHFIVEVEGKLIGPDAQGGFADEPIDGSEAARG